MREGDLEAGLVQLPIDDRELDVQPPILTHEVVCLGRSFDTAEAPLTMGELAELPLVLPEARWSVSDPIRRQLTERAQETGVHIAPLVEVEFQAAALELANRGVGYTVVSLPAAEKSGHLDHLEWRRFEPPLHEAYSFVTRIGARPSTATLELIRMIHGHFTEAETKPSQP